MAKNQAKAKQYPEDELLLFENYLLSSLRYHPKLIENIVIASVSVLMRLYCYEIIMLLKGELMKTVCFHTFNQFFFNLVVLKITRNPRTTSICFLCSKR